MRRFLSFGLLFLICAATFPAVAATGRVVKVLPHFLDLKGRHSLSPSLYDRDAYQAQLRLHPEQRSGIRFDVHWRAFAITGKLKLRAELRGTAQGNVPRQTTIETDMEAGKAGGNHWTQLPLTGEAYKNFGEVTAWRVTLWDGDQLIGEQKSFLW
jgi:hypothetical protein